MECAWKPNWDETRQHLLSWWHRDGLVLGGQSVATPGRPHEAVGDPGPAPSIEVHYTDTAWRARHNHYTLSRQTFCADTMPIAATSIGPGSLALLLGSEPGFSEETVWFYPAFEHVADPETLPPFRFDASNRWWQITEATLRECLALGRGKYLVGCPDLIENIDILSALRGPQQMMVDLIERSDWVSEKVCEINQVWFEAYRRVYEMTCLADGSSVFGPFSLWGPGKTAKLQCDASAMFSPAMFERFVVPALTEQCAWLDHSLFHLDGHQCLCHLDALCAIDALGAIEWTPDPTVPTGGSPAWYPLYRRLLAAGKSVQAVGVKPEEVIPLLDAVGGKGMYIVTSFADQRQAENLLEQVRPYR